MELLELLSGDLAGAAVAPAHCENEIVALDVCACDRRVLVELLGVGVFVGFVLAKMLALVLEPRDDVAMRFGICRLEMVVRLEFVGVAGLGAMVIAEGELVAELVDQVLVDEVEAAVEIVAGLVGALGLGVALPLHLVVVDAAEDFVI